MVSFGVEVVAYQGAFDGSLEDFRIVPVLDQDLGFTPDLS